jgi:hypothetical protein
VADMRRAQGQHERCDVASDSCCEAACSWATVLMSAGCAPGVDAQAARATTPSADVTIRESFIGESSDCGWRPHKSRCMPFGPSGHVARNLAERVNEPPRRGCRVCAEPQALPAGPVRPQKREQSENRPLRRPPLAPATSPRVRRRSSRGSRVRP